MAKLERTYNIPLRKAFQRAPHYRRTKRAINQVKIFLKRHMKSNNIKLGNHLNEAMWARGIKNPPHHIKVTAVRDDDGLVKAELFGFDYKHLSKDEIEAKEKKQPSNKLEEAIDKIAPKKKKNKEKETQIEDKKAAAEEVKVEKTEIEPAVKIAEEPKVVEKKKKKVAKPAKKAAKPTEHKKTSTKKKEKSSTKSKKKS